MKLELEIPLSDLKGFVDELTDHVNKGCLGSKTILLRNQIIEEGGYSIEFQTKKAYCHDVKHLTNNGKVVIKIDTVAPDTGKPGCITPKYGKG